MEDVLEDICAQLLFNDEGTRTISFTHNTARDFLLTQHVKANPPCANERVAHACLKMIMSNELRHVGKVRLVSL